MHIEPKSSAQKPKIAVLIRTFNSEGTLEQVLTRLKFDPEDELVVVDSGSTDETLAIATRYAARIVQLHPPFNYSGSLNAGFRIARPDWVLVLSSHCIPLRPDLLDRMRVVAADSASEIAVIYGAISLFDPGKLPPVVLIGDKLDWQRQSSLRGGNGFAMYRKSLWEKYQFDESLRTAEDMDWLVWALDNDHRASVVCDAVVLYRNRGGLVYMFRKGWHETLHAMIIKQGSAGGRSWLDALRSFALNGFYLTMGLVRRRFGWSTYFRMLAHGLGAALAGSSPAKRRI